jgi:colanic acid biosynthesis glycosyl transferase WcaI
LPYLKATFFKIYSEYFTEGVADNYEVYRYVNYGRLRIIGGFRLSMNITILSLIFPPETGSSRRIGELCEYLAAQGHHVHVITGFPSYPTGILYPGYRKKLLARNRLNEFQEITRVWLYTSTNRSSSLKRIVHYVTFSFMAMIGALTGKKPDVIYVVSHPYFLGLTANAIRFLRGGRIVLDVQDSWPEAPIALGYIKWPWLVRLLVWTEKKVYRSSDLILTLAPEMAEHLVARGAEARRVKVIYNWVDHERYAPMDGSDLRRRLGMDGMFVLLFAGNIGKPQGLEVVIGAAGITANTGNIRYVIIGDGAEKRSLEELVQARGLTNVIFLPSVPETEIIEYLSMADALLVHLKKAPHRMGIVPSKLQVYMACGKPILLGADGAPARIVREASCGVLFEPDHPQGLATAVQTLSTADKREREAMGSNGRDFAMRHFDLKSQCALSESLIADLMRT